MSSSCHMNMIWTSFSHRCWGIYMSLAASSLGTSAQTVLIGDFLQWDIPSLHLETNLHMIHPWTWAFVGQPFFAQASWKRLRYEMLAFHRSSHPSAMAHKELWRSKPCVQMRGIAGPAWHAVYYMFIMPVRTGADNRVILKDVAPSIIWPLRRSWGWLLSWKTTNLEGDCWLSFKIDSWSGDECVGLGLTCGQMPLLRAMAPSSLNVWLGLWCFHV